MPKTAFSTGLPINPLALVLATIGPHLHTVSLTHSLLI
jgi:hypothetical protein